MKTENRQVQKVSRQNSCKAVDICLINRNAQQSGKLIAFLNYLGYSADFCSNVESGLLALENTQYRLIILELTPKEDMESAEDFIAIIKKHPNKALRDIPILLMTDDAKQETLLRVFGSGANDYLVKPIVPHELRSRILGLIQVHEKPIFAEKTPFPGYDKPDVNYQQAGSRPEIRREQPSKKSEQVIIEIKPDPLSYIVLKKVIKFSKIAAHWLARSSAAIVTKIMASDLANKIKPYALRNQKTAIALAVVLALVILSGISKMFSHHGILVQTVTVVKGDIYTAVNITGYMSSAHEADLSPAISGSVKNIVVSEGQWVKAGEVLLRLDSEDVIASMHKNDLALKEADNKVRQTKDNLKRLNRLYSVGGIAKIEVDDELHRLQALVSSRDQLAQELQAARVQVQKSFVAAPFDGEVASIAVKEGEWVTPARSVVTLVNTRKPEIKANLDASDLSHVKPGQKGVVSSDSIPDKEWIVTVSSLSPSVKKENGANSVDMALTFDGEAPPLKYRQQLDVEVKADYKKVVNKVVYSAIINKDNQNFVAVIEDDKLKYVPVKTGVESMTHIEIESGVTEGQVIALPTDGFDEGVYVTTE